ncbi:hypothetical protein H7J08_23060 [Mycobacterium frederiksbergense]|uniref:hypothetical protein n=1 Tax=Mycolicibacterium frederiksbergense TaxID=117567 RepID=UPI0021F2B509|nr:hypothetical protein [Mycolicibacterium frederiksbergense]MCV7047517.1 hypothetical protein [Mycolicibacterium frederiksbergense]
MTRWTLPGNAARFGASVLAAAAAAALVSAPAANAESALVPLLVKGHNVDDSGKELGPNRFQIGRDGTLTVSLQWETNDGGAVAAYCHEVAKILDGHGNVVFERQQDLGGGCTSGGNWRARLKGLGNFRYVLDVTDRDNGANYHAELPFDVVLF